ncbi:DUF2779 domain-containing protein [Chloroflexota bacterium]
MKQELLSKSKYLIGLQCPKLLWLQINDPKQLPQVDLSTQFIFDQGHVVGELAKKLFLGGTDVSTDDFMGNVGATRELLNQRKLLFEAGIMAGRIYSRLDVLRPSNGDQWDIIEVKSSTSVKDVNIQDVTFQKHCCESQGLTINHCYLAYINNQYPRNGEIDPQELFKIDDITDLVDEASHGIHDRIDNMFEYMAREKCPEIGIGPHCRDPYQCALAECWDFLPEPNIFNLYYGGKKCFELCDSGIFTVKAIPDSYKLNGKQSIQRDCEISGQPHVDREAINDFLTTLQYPLYYLDFETIGPAVPLFDGTRPYQAVPFQFSLHVVNGEKASPEHFSFLAGSPDDPRPAFLAELKKVLGNFGSIVVYNQGFEEGILKELAKVFPEYDDWITGVRGRLVDLLQPFRSFHYYHPQQKGSASIKKVLPALTGKSYDGMEISEGGEASIKYYTVTYGEATEEGRNKVRADLEKYCALDTEGMIWIVEKLMELCDCGGL